MSVEEIGASAATTVAMGCWHRKKLPRWRETRVEEEAEIASLINARLFC